MGTLCEVRLELLLKIIHEGQKRPTEGRREPKNYYYYFIHASVQCLKHPQYQKKDFPALGKQLCHPRFVSGFSMEMLIAVKNKGQLCAYIKDSTVDVRQLIYLQLTTDSWEGCLITTALNIEYSSIFCDDYGTDH